MNFCKDCKYYEKYVGEDQYYRDTCNHPNFRKFDYVSGNVVRVPDCNVVRRYESECKLFEKKETFWEWLRGKP